jgi:hypothetical protein
MGESERDLRQLGDLRLELSDALSLAAVEPYREAALGYANVLGSLRWSDHALTLLRHAEASATQHELQRGPLSVCADMKAWANSGYRTLSLATKTFVREQEVALAEIFRRAARNGFPSPEQLTPDEGPGDKLLKRKINALRKARRPFLNSLQVIDTDVASALGIAREPETKSPDTASVVIGRGRTAAGSGYTIRLERQQPPQTKQAGPIGPEPSCRFQVSVSEAGNQGEGESELVVVSAGGTCLSTSHPERPNVGCDAGLLTIEGQTLARTRSVRLRLSDGRQITSRVALVPARLGGPAGFYYQAVRGPSPIPVSLTELDAHNRVLRTIKLNRIRECSKHPITFLPGGLRTIVHGVAPGGPAFAIVGERYRTEGEVHFKLKVEVGEEGLSGGGFLGVVPRPERPGQKPGPFSLEISKGCQPHEYAILYGILKSPRDTVLARTAGALRPLSRVRMPASLHVGGVLVYVALSQVPSEVLVRTPSGKTVFTEKLAGLAREAAETCEGEAEGPSV